MIKVFHFQGTYTTNVPSTLHCSTIGKQYNTNNVSPILRFGPLEFTSTFNGCVNIFRLIINIKRQSFLMPREL